jgi:hypothetical protein
VKATLRLPSKAVQYGYAEVVTDVPDDAEAFGQFYVNFVHAFLTGEQKGMNGLTSSPKTAASAAPGSPQAAADRLAEGKLPRTVDEANEMATQVIKSELGATVVSEAEKPWEAKVDTPKKPWENDGAAPKAAPKLTADW